jgi:O-antigen/teichoic acid export membrane protein
VASRMVGSVSAVMAVAIFVGAISLSKLFGEPALTPMIRAASLGIVPAALTVLYARALTGSGRPAIAEFGERAGYQVIFVLLIVGLMGALGDTALGASYSAGRILMLALLAGVWTRLVPRSVSLPGRPSPTGELLRSGLPLLLAGAIELIIVWSDTLMIGYFLNSTDVGVYGAASRTAAVVSFVVLAAGSVAAPRFAIHFSRGDLDALRSLYRRASLWSGGAAVVIALPLIALAPYVLSIFGEGFSEGATALRILVLAGVVNGALGLLWILLVMVTRSRPRTRSP